MKATEVSTGFKSSNGAIPSFKDKVDTAMDSAPDVLAKATEMGKSLFTTVADSRVKIMEALTASYKAIDKNVKERPWTSVGAAAALGFAGGYLVARARKSHSPSLLKPPVDNVKKHMETGKDKLSEHLQ